MRSADQEFVVACWQAGVNSVLGDASVARALKHESHPRFDCILAVGKAAAAMYQGALHSLGYEPRGIMVTKYGHVPEELSSTSSLEVIQSAHPIPDTCSLEAGRRCLEFVSQIGEDENLLVLVSGGASSLVEHLPENMSLDELKSLTDSLISEGYSIDQINAVRRQFSLIKGGRLLAAFKGNRALTYAISDVPGDDVEVIGSGIGGRGPVPALDFDLPAAVSSVLDRVMSTAQLKEKGAAINWKSNVVASNQVARDHACNWAEARGVGVVFNAQTMHDDVNTVACHIVETVKSGSAGIYIFGGEPTVVLPENPGAGGRNQHLGLLLARAFEGNSSVTMVVGGTDGTDGETDLAGAVVDGDTWSMCADPVNALESADSSRALESAGALLDTGPTGTNVMDLVVVLKRDG